MSKLPNLADRTIEEHSRSGKTMTGAVPRVHGFKGSWQKEQSQP